MKFLEKMFFRNDLCEMNFKEMKFSEIIFWEMNCIHKKLWSNRTHPSQSEQKTLEMFFVKEEPRKINMETQNLLLVEEEKKEETKVLGHLDLNQHYKKRVKSDKKMLDLKIQKTLKKNAQSSDAFVVISWDI